ncbi:Stp1/IreP family PP2C-type Ser/Thr phosphatase [Salimicrobium salexigens]|uniref:Protein phosphatase n=1 Tax=Salimicrobium salexigens TaxID=908941 RepID=A0ABY1KUG8_9BACI|nr:Stp1/IreP family PP2C-type Ser/Thr phosphatase [Salimicrobium salexigens]SIS62333.1 protein phosphatase [Salimicrobium salexigens]
MEGLFRTDKGKVRPHNEDSGSVSKHPYGNFWLAIVADGMGGHRAGDVASKIAVDRMKASFNEKESFTDSKDIKGWFEEIIHEINGEVLRLGSLHREYQGMGTTVVAAVCTPHMIGIVNVGDSRCYIADVNGFHQATSDHSLVNEMVRAGRISEEEAEDHPRKNILTQAIGTEKNISPDLYFPSTEGETRILLCSDGLTDKVSDPELSKLQDFSEQDEGLVQHWIDLANERGGEDNISLAVIKRSAFTDKEGER